MWKNKTTPNIVIQQCSASVPSPKIQHENMVKLCELSFADTEPLQKICKSQKDEGNGHIQFQSKSSIGYDSLNSKNQMSQLSFNLNQKLSKENLIMMELEQNEELRINLFKAEKTIQTLIDMAKNMQKGILRILDTKKQQMMTKINEKTGQLRNNGGLQNRKTKRNTNQDGKQNMCDPLIVEKQFEITEIWKKCYADLLQYVDNYSKDMAFLIEQYKALEQKSEKYKRSSRKSKKNEENLLKILKQSSNKLQRSEHTIEKAIEDLKERDNKIQEYQIQNKNIKMKILENLEQIQKLKRENKAHVRDCMSYKQVAKSLQDEIVDYQNKCQNLLDKIQNKEKLEQIYKDSQQALKTRIQGLEEQLNETKRFNENLMDEYKKLSSKIQKNEQKISQKYQASQLLHEHQTKTYLSTISTLQKQKQSLLQKSQQKTSILEQQLQKAFTIKASLQKQLTDRSLIIVQLQQEVGQYQEKFRNVQMDCCVRLEQKDRQITYLEELRNLGNLRNQELKEELEEVRADMVLIIQQLKVKELEIEKYKYASSPYEQKQNNLCHTSTQVKIKNKEDLIDSLFYRQIQNDPADEYTSEGENQGLVWKKISKQKEQNLYSLNTEEHPDLNSFSEQKILPYEDNNTSDRTIKPPTPAAPKQQPPKLPNRCPNISSFQLAQPSQQYKLVQKSSQKLNSPKNKFSLQAFQNKLVLEQSAKLFLQFNKKMFK